MPTVFRHRKLIAFVCIAALFLAAITPATWGLLSGALVPLGPLFDIVVSAATNFVEQRAVAPFTYLETIGSRGPPAV